MDHTICDLFYLLQIMFNCTLLNVDQVVLEAEVDNSAALRLYENLGFIRDKRLHKYYLNGHDAFRLHLLLG